MLVYIFHNAKKHGVRLQQQLDSFSSAAWFDGWKRSVRVVRNMLPRMPITPSQTWLVNVGWRQHGLIGVDEMPRQPG